MRIAVTGSDGMLGHDICQVFTDIELVPLTIGDLDITDLDRAASKIREVKPDYLIHAAAHTDVDDCELQPEKALLVNGLGTRNVVMACEAIFCPVMYISTDYVFDGQQGTPYREWDTPHPVNTYGYSKLLGERFVTSLTNRFHIVRTSWLYGNRGKNFVDTMITLFTKQKEVEVVDDQVGSPTYTHDLAVKLRELVTRGYGIYHITNTSLCSWYDLAVEIARITNVKVNIRPTTTENLQRPAKRPRYSVLDNTMLALERIEAPRHWKTALRDYLAPAGDP